LTFKTVSTACRHGRLCTAGLRLRASPLLCTACELANSEYTFSKTGAAVSLGKNDGPHLLGCTGQGRAFHRPFGVAAPNGGFGVWWLCPPIPALAGNAIPLGGLEYDISLEE